MLIRMRLVIFWPDTHAPYHHVRAVRGLLECLSYFSKFKIELIILGDFGDFYSVNLHGKHPRMQDELIKEVEGVNEILDQIDEIIPRKKKVFLEGNHENRLERYITKCAPALFGVTDPKDLLGFNNRPGWKYLPFYGDQSFGISGADVWARHTPLSMSSPKASMSHALCSHVYGHVHRKERFTKIGLDGREYFSACPGWLGDKRKKEVFDYQGRPQNWQVGLSYMWVDGKYKSYHDVSISEKTGRFIFEGKAFKP